MRQGTIVETGTRDEVLLTPQNAYTRQLLAAVPRIRAHPVAEVHVDAGRSILPASPRSI